MWNDIENMDKKKVLVKSYRKYGRKASWIVERYEKYGKNASRIVIRYGQYGRK